MEKFHQTPQAFHHPLLEASPQIDLSCGNSAVQSMWQCFPPATNLLVVFVAVYDAYTSWVISSQKSSIQELLQCTLLASSLTFVMW